MAERVTEIYSLLIPLVDGRLIIPRACVSEVIGFATPSEMTGAPPWYVGTVPWNGRQVPLVSFEGACGNNIPPASGRTRIVVFPCREFEIVDVITVRVAQQLDQQACTFVLRLCSDQPLKELLQLLF